MTEYSDLPEAAVSQTPDRSKFFFFKFPIYPESFKIRRVFFFLIFFDPLNFTFTTAPEVNNHNNPACSHVISALITR
jgi:hypothetical protein